MGCLLSKFYKERILNMKKNKRYFFKVITSRILGDIVSSITEYIHVDVEVEPGLNSITEAQERKICKNLCLTRKNSLPNYHRFRAKMIPPGQFMEESNEGIVLDKILSEMKPTKWS